MYVYFSVMLAQKKLLQLNFSSIEELDEVMTERRMKPSIITVLLPFHPLHS